MGCSVPFRASRLPPRTCQRHRPLERARPSPEIISKAHALRALFCWGLRLLQVTKCGRACPSQDDGDGGVGGGGTAGVCVTVGV